MSKKKESEEDVEIGNWNQERWNDTVKAVEEETRQEGKEENKEPKHKEDNQSKPSKGSTEETMKKSVNGAALDDAVSQKTYIPDFGNVGIKKNCFPVTNATSILKILMI